MPVIRPLGSRSPLGPPFDFSPVPRATDSPAGGGGNWFVRSAAVGSGAGRNWLNAFTTLTAAFAAAAAGDRIWVADDHAETQAGSLTLTSPGTDASPCTVACVNHLGSTPPVSADLRTTASVSSTGSFLNIAGSAYVYGIRFDVFGANNLTCGNGSGSLYFDACQFQVLAGGSVGTVLIGQNAGATSHRIIWNNTTLKLNATGQGVSFEGARFIWRNTASAIVGTVPTTLFKDINGITSSVLLEGVDLSALGAGNTISGTEICPHQITLLRCKLGASVTVAATPTAAGGAATDLIQCDSAGTNYRQERYRYEGTLVTETTIVRTGGASDGTTPISWKIATTANSKWVSPFDAFPIAIWSDTISPTPVTVTIEGIWGSTNLPATDDIWIEVEDLGASGNPQGSFQSGSKADILAIGTLWPSSASTWGGSTTAFSMSISFTPQQKGLLYITVKAAKAGTTFYIDPKATLS